MPGRDHRVDCKVEIDPQKALGVYANAFRVQESADGRSLLEFLVYSENERRAEVVMRVPVRKTFLPIIRDRIDECLAATTLSTG
jgi:hypothetical protein